MIYVSGLPTGRSRFYHNLFTKFCLQDDIRIKISIRQVKGRKCYQHFRPDRPGVREINLELKAASAASV